MTTGLEALSVLLADDNPHMRDIVGVLLNNYGIKQIRTVHDGKQGIDMLRFWQPDLAIVDFKMEPVDGVEFTRFVRNSPQSRNPYLPVIMMTGHSARSRVYEARDAGVTEFVVKPVNARTLLDRIMAVVYRPRPFVRTKTYFGPDRRRRADPDYQGPLRRAADSGGRSLEDSDFDDALAGNGRDILL
jgi:two-component system, chemotaxis family, chemotaxis protein CheY